MHKSCRKILGHTSRCNDLLGWCIRDIINTSVLCITIWKLKKKYTRPDSLIREPIALYNARNNVSRQHAYTFEHKCIARFLQQCHYQGVENQVRHGYNYMSLGPFLEVSNVLLVYYDKENTLFSMQQLPEIPDWPRWPVAQISVPSSLASSPAA